MTTKTFFGFADQIDDLINLPSPTQEDMKLLLSLVESESLKQYFFKHLANSGNRAWFPILREHGFFNELPAPVKVEGVLTYPHWPALAYLVAITPKLPDDSIKVIENIQLESAFVMSALVVSFTKIPAAFAPRICPIILSWLSKGLPVAEELIGLFKYWARSKQWECALSLFDAILTPHEVPTNEERRKSKYYSPTARFREFPYTVEDFLKVFPNELEFPWIEILNILESNLIRALEIEEGQEQYSKSSYWRSSIEPSSQNFGDRCKDLLVDAVIRIINKLTPEQISNIVERFINHPSSIFRRLAINIVRINNGLWTQFLNNLYEDPKYWEDISYYHEYWLLTQDTFSALADTQQRAYIDRLYADLDLETGNEDEKQRSRHWVYRRLWAIKNQLPEKDIHIFEELRKEFKEPDPEEWFQFLAYSSELQTGSVSPTTSKELVKLSLSEVLAELKKPFPSDLTSFGGPTIDGLANELEIAVHENPSHFASIAPSIFDKEIHPLYANYVIRGFTSAWKDQRPFDWDPIIKLCNIISQTSEVSSIDGNPPDLEQHYWYNTYSSARKAVVELFWVALTDDKHAIPHQYLDDIRSILLRLSDDLNPTPEYEKKQTTEGNWTYLDLSLNVTRAKAIAALIQYALHRSRVAKNDESAKDLLPHGLRVEPQVIEKLNETLDKKFDPSKAVHINFGIYLPNLNYLDRDWLINHMKDIFPHDPKLVGYWQAAWEGYMWRNEFFASLYPDLKPDYRYAIEQLRQGIGREAKNTENRLASHLALLYANGNESLTKDDSLIVQFFSVASDELRGEFVKSLNPIRIPASLSSQSDEWKRLKYFWRQRYTFIQTQEKHDNYKEELAAFLLWVPHIPEPLKSFEEMIEASALVAKDWNLINLFEYLAKVANDYPAFVINLFEKSLRRTDLPYFFIAQSEVILKILNTAIHSEDQEARESAIRAINLYGERGDEGYRDLLKEI